MPENDVHTVTKEWLQSQLRSSNKSLIVLDCRSSNEFQEGHIRSAVNFSIPTLILKRLATGKIDINSTIKCRDLKQRIQNAYNDSVFVLYSDNRTDNSTEWNSSNETTTINVLHRRLKQDGCRVFCLKDGFTSFRDAFPEWCEDGILHSDTQRSRESGHSEQLMGLRSLRISMPHTDSACSSSTDSSDCENTYHSQQSEAPVEIVPGLYLGNASHSEDSKALQKYNIQYVLNVTPDLPNVFESTGTIKYLQIPITDHGSQDLAIHFPAAIKFIDEARTNQSAVLVHCLAGVSRSVTVTLAYLMHERALCLEEAFTLVRHRKPDISPNFHFLRQLHSFERQLVDLNTSRTPLSAQSGDSSYMTPDCVKNSRTGRCSCVFSVATPQSFPSEPSTNTDKSPIPTKDLTQEPKSEQPIDECKCMQVVQVEYLGTGFGVSPDSGIEFDRWTPAEGTPK